MPRNRPVRFDPEHYALYCSYIRDRHGDTAVSDTVLPHYHEFLVAPWGGETCFLELHLDPRLMAVAATDRLPGCLSAVYYAILCQTEAARRLWLEHLYLGYWIGGCPKMSYKEHFCPLEAWLHGRWQWYDRGTEMGRFIRAHPDS